MEYTYSIQLAGRSVNVEPDTWRKISDYIHSEQWFYIVYMGKLYKYSMTRTYYDRPALYIFDVFKGLPNEAIKYIYIN